jgi:hypothetical protein
MDQTLAFDGGLEDLVGGLGDVVPVEKQCLTLGTFGLGADPRILVGEAPGLNRSAARMSQTRGRDPPVDFRLPGKVGWTRMTRGVERNRDGPFP